MDDVRQFGDCLRYEPTSQDLIDFRGFGIGDRLAEFTRSLRLQEDLARVVEAEVIPRLMLAHRSESTQPECNILPDADQIAVFAALMLAPAGDDLDLRLAELLATGLAPDSLLLDLLAPTARHLGALWEEDLCDFVEVTRAMGRLQRIMREITQRFGGAPAQPRDPRSIFLLPCPGETHSFGLAMVDRFFRDAGWNVTCTVSQPDDPLAQVRTDWFDVVGLSLACEVLLPKLAETITALRRHSHNPAIRVMVGGPAFVLNPDAVRQVGADASAGDAKQALHIAETLLDLQAGAC
ncbi:MAG: Cobalamin-binding protein [Methylobacterium sp.]|nr:Cobalamin-binding protein [Methylobacterium sp.]